MSTISATGSKGSWTESPTRVASPDHVERGIRVLIDVTPPSFTEAATTLREVLTQLETEHVREGSRFFGRLDLDRVGALGHSAGANTVFEIAGDAAISAWAGLAGGKLERDPGKPALLLAASRDVVVPAQL